MDLCLGHLLFNKMHYFSQHLFLYVVYFQSTLYKVIFVASTFFIFRKNHGVHLLYTLYNFEV